MQLPPKTVADLVFPIYFYFFIGGELATQQLLFLARGPRPPEPFSMAHLLYWLWARFEACLKFRPAFESINLLGLGPVSEHLDIYHRY